MLSILILVVLVMLASVAFAEEIEEEDVDLSGPTITFSLPPIRHAIVQSAYDTGDFLIRKAENHIGPHFLFSVDEFKYFTSLDARPVKSIVIGSDPAFDLSGNPNVQAITQIKEMFENGATVITSGKSTAIPALLGGSNGPKFYHFSGMPRPYGNSQKVRNYIADPAMRKPLGNATEFMAHSVLPQKNHSLIASAGTSKILTTADYVFEEIAYDYWGPYWNLFVSRVVTGIEYTDESSGGKVIYINTELSENERAGGLSQLFVNALIDPSFFTEIDERTLHYALKPYLLPGEKRPEAGQIIYEEANLNTVVYNNGIELPHNKTNRDVSYVFTMAGRKSYNPTVPNIDSSGELELIVSLYTPSGALYATRRALKDEADEVLRGVSVAVPASDNEVGNWKFVIEDVHGIDGNRVVLVAPLEGQENVGENVSMTPKKYLLNRPSLHSKADKNSFYYQLGGRGAAIDASSDIKSLSMGPLLDQKNIKFYRVDSDLFLEIPGETNHFIVNGWFKPNNKIQFISFSDGTKLSAKEISTLAIEKEPDILYELVSPEKRVVGTDHSEQITYDGEQDAILVGLRGDDTLVGSVKSSNIFYYRSGDGNDTLIINKGKGKINALRFHNDIKPEDVTVSQEGSALVFRILGGTITIPDGLSKLDRVEFWGGIVWDSRDVSKLVEGKKLTPRSLSIVTPNEENGDRKENSTNEGVSHSSCNSIGIAHLLTLLVLGGVCIGRMLK